MKKLGAKKVEKVFLHLIGEIIHFFACITIPTLSGILFYFINELLGNESNLYFINYGVGIGLLVWMLYLFLQSGSARLFLKECNKEDHTIISKMDDYSKECYCKVKEIYYCRDYAAKRLIQDEFWIQIISIYYSVFTAMLAILSLVGGELNDFLDVPSVMFTVAVALLVIFANAQRCGSRANDLSSNCSDLGERFSEVLSAIDNSDHEPTGSGSGNGFTPNHEKLKEYMSRFYKNLGDSEEHSIVDEWKYRDYWIYYVYLSIKIIFIYALIMIPIIFVFCNSGNFMNLLNSRLPGKEF